MVRGPGFKMVWKYSNPHFMLFGQWEPTKLSLTLGKKKRLVVNTEISLRFKLKFTSIVCRNHLKNPPVGFYVHFISFGLILSINDNKVVNMAKV